MVDNTLFIYPINETYIQLDSTDRGILIDIYEYMSFFIPGSQYSEAFKNKKWDGKIRLLNSRTFKIYKGLLQYIEEYAISKNWNVVKDLLLKVENEQFDAVKFCNSLNLKLTPYDFQYEAIQNAVDTNRATFESPTSSGKSLIIYCLVRYFLHHKKRHKKILIIEPTVRLVNQMLTEFGNYSPDFSIEKSSHKIFASAEKNTEKPIIISTWQALVKQSKKYFDQFDVIMIDETHLLKAASIKSILEKATNTKYRFGFTGTLDNKECNRLVIEGLTGPAIQVAETKELMDKGITAELFLKCVILNYPDEIRKQNKKLKYQEEIDFIVHHPERNRFIANLCATIKPDENTLILTEFHDKKKHCDILREEIEKTCPNKKIIVVNGKTKQDSEEVRKYLETNIDVILIATFGVFSTGVSINNIQNLIFATFSKSMIKVLQSIGRGLRLDGKTNTVIGYDIVDDFKYKKKKNYLMKHFLERIKIYLKSGFKYKIHNIKL